MAKANVLLFTSPTCPHCPSAKAIAEKVAKSRDDVRLRLIVSGQPGAERLFKHYDVMSVPTFIIRGPGYPHNIGLRGTQSEGTLNKYIDIALGLKEPEVKKSFFEKLMEKIKA